MPTPFRCPFQREAESILRPWNLSTPHHWLRPTECEGGDMMQVAAQAPGPQLLPSSSQKLEVIMLGKSQDAGPQVRSGLSGSSASARKHQSTHWTISLSEHLLGASCVPGLVLGMGCGRIQADQGLRSGRSQLGYSCIDAGNELRAARTGVKMTWDPIGDYPL